MFYQDPKSALRILGVYYVERAPRVIFEQERRYTALSYRIAGSSVFEDGEGAKQARDGAVTYIPAGCDYRHSNREREKIIILHLEHYGAGEDTLQVLPNASFVEPLFRDLLSAWEAGEEGAYPRCVSILYAIFEMLCKNQPRQALQPPKAIAAGVAVLRENFRNSELSVAHLAERSFVSEVYFRRLFYAHFGCSPLQMLLQLRFDYATRLLSSGYYTPKQVAALSGFSDVKYFRTAYKKRFGRTPSSVIPQTRDENK